MSSAGVVYPSITAVAGALDVAKYPTLQKAIKTAKSLLDICPPTHNFDIIEFNTQSLKYRATYKDGKLTGEYHY